MRNPSVIGENAVVARRRIKLETLVVSAGIALGLVLIIMGFGAATTGRESLGYPDAITSVSPAPNDRQVLATTEISVDLEDGYRARLTLDGIDIPTNDLEDVAGRVPEPGQQVDIPPTAIYDQGNSLIRFQPADGAVIERYETGIHDVTVTFWKIVDGEESARSYSWRFEVL
jgi:hypothetical protein